MIIDSEEIASQLRQFREDSEFLERLRPELQSMYPNCWIAVYEKTVVAVAWTVRDIMQQLEDQKVPKARAVLNLLNTNPVPLILYLPCL